MAADDTPSGDGSGADAGAVSAKQCEAPPTLDLRRAVRITAFGEVHLACSRASHPRVMLASAGNWIRPKRSWVSHLSVSRHRMGLARKRKGRTRALWRETGAPPEENQEKQACSTRSSAPHFRTVVMALLTPCHEPVTTSSGWRSCPSQAVWSAVNPSGQPSTRRLS